MKALLSIKPEYAERIFSRQKKFEFRRSIFNPSVSTVLVYASSPMRLVVGEFEVDAVIHDTVETLWKKTKHYAGISEENFFRYFWDKKKGYAIRIGQVRQYKRPLPLKTFRIAPPQSFVYLRQSK